MRRMTTLRYITCWLCLCPLFCIAQANQNDSLALVALYNATDGANWNITWDLTQPVTQWYGVDFDQNGRVAELNLFFNNINGSIPPEIGNLMNLTNLDLFGNQLSGNIPPEIDNLTNLTYLDLTYTGITGSIPPKLGNLTNLTSLYLSDNKLSGGIPSDLGNLTNLTHLDLSYNGITGSIPLELGNLANLTYLNLSSNQLSGCYDENLMNLCSISVSMQGNLIYVPWEDFCTNGVGCSDSTQCHIDDWTALKALYESTDGDNWSDNSRWGQIIGTIPPANCYIAGMYGVTLDENGRVKKLNLPNNNLTGSIPPEIGNLTNLTHLILAENYITGSIPPELGSLMNLTHLDLYFNNINGSIPPEIGNLINLTYLDLFFNNINGSIPPEIGKLTNLTYLDLFSNNINGSIPPEIGKLMNLTYLDLGYNQLSGCYDENLMNLCSISVSMQGNLIYVPWEDFCAKGVGCSDSTQCHIDDWTALKALYESTDGDNWSDNSGWGQIIGTTPPANCYIAGMYGVTLDENGRVKKLNLTNNNLTGSIPPEIGNLTNLTHLIFGHNDIIGSIPPEIGNLMNLTHLILRGNTTGSIPPKIGNLTNLTYLSLGGITGSIPPEIGNLTNLTYLSLGGNITGSIPPEIGNLMNLTSLILGGNITGSIPPEIGNLMNLTSLILGGNDITGSIPPEIGNLTNLTFLDLVGNDITGSIPSEIGKLTNLADLYLDNNNITGGIPSEISKLTNLFSLFLNNNNITGSIPPEIGNLTLFYLDLTNNQLSGVIPPLDITANFSVSYNNFSQGDIAANYSINNMANYSYSPQYHGEVQSLVVEQGDSLEFTLSTPLPGNNNQNVSYQWKRNDDTLVAAVDSIYLINNLQLSDVGKYTLHMTDSTRVEDLEVISKPIYVIVPGYDLYGQPVEYNQLIIEFDDLEDKEDYEVNHLFPNGAFETDHCSCNRPLYLYQFPNDTIAFQTLLDINTKKQSQTTRGRIDGGFNNILGIGPIPGTQGWTWTYDYPPSYDDSVTIFLLDSGADTLNWNARPYLDAAAAIDSCYEIEPSTGYDYTDTLTSPDTLTLIRPGHIDSIGHGTFGMRSIAESTDAYMNMNIVPLKVFDENGRGTLFNFICALYHAIDHDADIINISAGYSGQPSEILEEAVALAHSKGQFIVTATGNEGVNIDSFPQYPAYYAKPFCKTAYDDTDSLVHYNNVISVAAIDATDSLWQYSNYGKEAATISAYGENMAGYSHKGEAVSYSGTSISTYYVTRQLAAEIARDTTPRSLEDIWLDFEDGYLRDCSATTGLTSTGKRLDISLREVYGDLRVFLEGAFDTLSDTMHTDLNTLRHILPGQIDSTFNDTLAVQPYNIAPFHYDGIERVPAIFSDYPPEVVDWILVSARTEIDADSTVSRTAAWLLEDGRIQLLKPLFDELVNAPDSVYIVIEHRNHIGVMSPQKLPVDRNVIVWDFTAQDSYTSTGIGQKMLNDLRWGMLSGDTNSDLDGYDINGCDKGFWIDDNGKFNVYLPTDFNMNGDVNGEDKVLWFHNNGQFSSVPRY